MKGNIALKRKYYLIDTENVGDKWYGLLDKVKKKDRIVTFYTENHSKQLEEFLLKHVNNSQIIWLECTVGNNALDYQLVGVLAYLIVKHPKASFCIYSNDKGYQKSVDFWQSRGVRISQKGLDEKKKEKKKNKQSKKKKATQIVQKTLTEEQYINEIAKSIPISNLNGWYCALTVILGQQKGRNWYQKIRSDQQLCDRLNQYFEGDHSERGIRLTALVLCAAKLDHTQAEKIYKVIQAHDRKDLNTIKIQLDRMFGKKGQNPYYKAVRPVVLLVKDL